MMNGGERRLLLFLFYIQPKSEKLYLNKALNFK
ncbi:hypothetical protein DFR62_1176 [Planococcus citreus]|uniref:Uncharacterized protein n=1 Tax=Planococcus citreus TaxID=1373 RepID=A0A497YIZ3_9BACL|nr:hypothetical protein DFR62_1176 [Planococcus citreus]